MNWSSEFIFDVMHFMMCKDDIDYCRTKFTNGFPSMLILFPEETKFAGSKLFKYYTSQPEFPVMLICDLMLTTKGLLKPREDHPVKWKETFNHFCILLGLDLLYSLPTPDEGITKTVNDGNISMARQVDCYDPMYIFSWVDYAISTDIAMAIALWKPHMLARVLNSIPTDYIITGTHVLGVALRKLDSRFISLLGISRVLESTFAYKTSQLDVLHLLRDNFRPVYADSLMKLIYTFPTDNDLVRHCLNELKIHRCENALMSPGLPFIVNFVLDMPEIGIPTKIMSTEEMKLFEYTYYCQGNSVPVSNLRILAPDPMEPVLYKPIGPHPVVYYMTSEDEVIISDTYRFKGLLENFVSNEVVAKLKSFSADGKCDDIYRHSSKLSKETKDIIMKICQEWKHGKIQSRWKYVLGETKELVRRQIQILDKVLLNIHSVSHDVSLPAEEYFWK